jgi:hypothetical protein
MNPANSIKNILYTKLDDQLLFIQLINQLDIKLYYKLYHELSEQLNIVQLNNYYLT